MSVNLVWVEDFKVHSYEVDFRRRAPIDKLCLYFQEAAWNHAEALGVGYNRLFKEQKLWVLSRLLVEVHGFPHWAEVLTVKTWPRSAKSVFAFRDFQILNSKGSQLLAGTSAWLVVDAITRKPQRPDKLLQTFNELPPQRATSRDPDKVTGMSPPLPDATTNVVVRYADLDVNGHVNNAWYTTAILNSYPVNFHRQHSVAFLEVNYLAETGEGDNLSIVSGALNLLERTHSLSRLKDGVEVCRARVKWRREDSAVKVGS
jgi:acyl-ACP thioesterase